MKTPFVVDIVIEWVVQCLTPTAPPRIRPSVAKQNWCVTTETANSWYTFYKPDLHLGLSPQLGLYQSDSCTLFSFEFNVAKLSNDPRDKTPGSEAVVKSLSGSSDSKCADGGAEHGAPATAAVRTATPGTSWQGQYRGFRGSAPWMIPMEHCFWFWCLLALISGNLGSSWAMR